MNGEGLLQLREVTKNFEGRKKSGEDVLAVDRLTLSCSAGELLGLIGPSGCGKSTTLRMIAGLEKPTAGNIILDGRDITHLRPSQRGIGLGFETYALYPPLNVYENIAFNLRAHHIDPKEIDRRVREVAERMRLGELLKARPSSLSSGQKQRVNLARALVRRPKLLLLDEPLSHLDGLERRHLRAEIKEMQRDWGIATILVTHDQEEAAALADRIAVVNEGVLQQLDDVQQLFDSPANLFTAGFIGDPPMNLWRATATASAGMSTVTVGESMRVSAPLPGVKGAVHVGVRPHDIRITQAGQGHVTGRVIGSEFLGEESHAQVMVGTVAVSVYGPTANIPAQVPVGLRFLRGHVFDGDTGQRAGTFSEGTCHWEVLAQPGDGAELLSVPNPRSNGSASAKADTANE